VLYYGQSLKTILTIKKFGDKKVKVKVGTNIGYIAKVDFAPQLRQPLKAVGYKCDVSEYLLLLRYFILNC